MNFGVSGMHRYYDTINLTGSKYNDLVNRADISRPDSARNRFAVPNLEPDLAPWNTGTRQHLHEKRRRRAGGREHGKTNVMVGARYDWLDVHSRIPEFVLTTPGLSVHGTMKACRGRITVTRDRSRCTALCHVCRAADTDYGIDGGIGITVAPDAMNDRGAARSGAQWSCARRRLVRRRERLSTDASRVLRGNDANAVHPVARLGSRDALGREQANSV